LAQISNDLAIGGKIDQFFGVFGHGMLFLKSIKGY
jgi:hypothetical protein